jgi:hypothetical protein
MVNAILPSLHQSLPSFIPNSSPSVLPCNLTTRKKSSQCSLHYVPFSCDLTDTDFATSTYRYHPQKHTHTHTHNWCFSSHAMRLGKEIKARWFAIFTKALGKSAVTHWFPQALTMNTTALKKRACSYQSHIHLSIKVGLSYFSWGRS